MGRQQFKVHFEGTAVIELDDAVIEVVDDEWRNVFYDLHTPEDIAEHVAFNLVVRNVPLSHMDGWADQPNRNAAVLSRPEWEVWVDD